jgi:phosphatidylserine/phosphatidylglycerophosphate/cardiolipin synthase-like enzyme
MQKVLSSDLWTKVRVTAHKARRRQAAIAYVTQDLLGFRRQDTLVVNASTSAIANAQANAELLLKLRKKGMRLYNSPCLHAKLVLWDDCAVIGSSNMSNSSVSVLVEVGLMTDNSATVAGVASFIEQLVSQSTQLETKDLVKLCKIKPVRRGRWLQGIRKLQKPKITRLGNRKWLVGIHELKDPPQSEQKLIDRATSVLRAKLNDPALAPDWIRWAGTSRFRAECQEGDSVIQIWPRIRQTGQVASFVAPVSC